MSVKFSESVNSLCTLDQYNRESTDILQSLPNNAKAEIKS